MNLLRQQLLSALDEKISAFETRIREKGNHQVLKEGQDAERRLNEASERCSQELQEALVSFASEKERLVASVRRLRERAADDFERSLQAIKDAQADALKETIQLQAVEVKSITAQLHEERRALRARVAEEKLHWRAQCQEKASKLGLAEEERLVFRLRKQMKEEAAEVLRSLAAETEKERRESRVRLEEEAQKVRRELENIPSRNESLRIIKRLHDIEDEISELRTEIDKGNDDLNAMAVTSSTLKFDASQLLAAIGSTEHAIQSFVNDEEVIVGDPRVTALNENLSKLRNTISALRAEKNAGLADFTEDLNMLKEQQKVMSFSLFVCIIPFPRMSFPTYEIKLKLSFDEETMTLHRFKGKSIALWGKIINWIRSFQNCAINFPKYRKN